MEQHRGADADSVNLHSSDKWQGYPADSADESMRLALGDVLAACLSAEISQIISRRVTISRNSTPRTVGSILPAPVRPTSRNTWRCSKRSVGPRQRHRHHAFGYFNLHIFGHSPLILRDWTRSFRTAV
jgi:hypothetical protein